MKKFLIAAISCILLYLLLDTAYYRWGIYFDFHREQDIEVFAATQGKEILLDTGSGMDTGRGYGGGDTGILFNRVRH